MTSGRAILRAVVGCGAVLVLSGCGVLPRSDGAREADRIVDVVSQAVAYPRQTSADGLTGAVRSTRVGETGGVEVIAADDLPPDPPARLAMRLRVVVTVPAQEGGGLNPDTPEYVACYDLHFDEYGPTGRDRVDCPADPRPVPTPAPEAHDAIAPGSDEALRTVLRRLQAEPSQPGVVRSIERALPDPGRDPSTGLANRRPLVRATVTAGDDVAVSVWAADPRDCLVGVRTSRGVDVGRLSREQVQAGELGCDPEAAQVVFDR